MTRDCGRLTKQFLSCIKLTSAEVADLLGAMTVETQTDARALSSTQIRQSANLCVSNFHLLKRHQVLGLLSFAEVKYLRHASEVAKVERVRGRVAQGASFS